VLRALEGKSSNDKAIVVEVARAEQAAAGGLGSERDKRGSMPSEGEITQSDVPATESVPASENLPATENGAS
jgi:hypothetical protein